MRILFDTHALIWFLSDSPRLPTDIRALLLRQDTHLFFSPVSVLEIAIKHSLKPEADAVCFSPCAESRCLALDSPRSVRQDACGAGAYRRHDSAVA